MACQPVGVMNRDPACLTRGYRRINIDLRRLYWQRAAVVGGRRRRWMGGCEWRRAEERTEVSGFQQKCRMCRSLLLPVGFRRVREEPNEEARTRTDAFLHTQQI